MVRIRKAATVGYIKNPRRPKDLNATYLDKYTDANIEPILRGYRIQNPRDKGTDATITELIKTTPNDLSIRETSLITYRDFGMEYALVKDKLEELGIEGEDLIKKQLKEFAKDLLSDSNPVRSRKRASIIKYHVNVIEIVARMYFETSELTAQLPKNVWDRKSGAPTLRRYKAGCDEVGQRIPCIRNIPQIWKRVKGVHPKNNINRRDLVKYVNDAHLPSTDSDAHLPSADSETYGLKLTIELKKKLRKIARLEDLIAENENEQFFHRRDGPYYDRDILEKIVPTIRNNRQELDALKRQYSENYAIVLKAHKDTYNNYAENEIEKKLTDDWRTLNDTLIRYEDIRDDGMEKTTLYSAQITHMIVSYHLKLEECNLKIYDSHLRYAENNRALGKKVPLVKIRRMIQDTEDKISQLILNRDKVKAAYDNLAAKRTPRSTATSPNSHKSDQETPSLEDFENEVSLAEDTLKMYGTMTYDKQTMSNARKVLRLAQRELDNFKNGTAA